MAAQPAVLTAEGNKKTGLGIFVAGLKCERGRRSSSSLPPVLSPQLLEVLRFGERRDCVVVESRPCQCHSTGSSSEVTERMKQRLFPEGRGGVFVFITLSM